MKYLGIFLDYKGTSQIHLLIPMQNHTRIFKKEVLLFIYLYFYSSYLIGIFLRSEFFVFLILKFVLLTACYACVIITISFQIQSPNKMYSYYSHYWLRRQKHCVIKQTFNNKYLNNYLIFVHKITFIYNKTVF